MEWKREEPKPQPPSGPRMKCGNVEISISPSRVHGTPVRQFCYICCATGEHSEASEEELRRTWPRRALEVVRDELKRFEDALNEAEAKRAAAELMDHAESHADGV